MSTLERTNQRNKKHQRKAAKTMKTITWTATDDGNKHTATNANGFEIGQVRVKLASRCEWPVLAASANGQTREFATVQSGKDWVEDLYNAVADAIENA